jgi:exopolysaccharide biosynthesis polyprenyl glycosylphosphotransferase
MSIHQTPYERRGAGPVPTRRRRPLEGAAPRAAPAIPLGFADSRAVRGVRSRERSYQLALLAADVVAAGLVVGLALTWLPTRELSWTALILPALVPPIHAANGLYGQDAPLLNKSTLEEMSVLFRAATMTTVIAYLLQSAVLDTPIGGNVVALIWLGLSISVPACRVLARAVLRKRLPPERCLVLGNEHDGRQLASKLNGAAGVKSQFVGVMPLAHARTAFDRLAEAVQRLEVHRVVVAPDPNAPAEELEAIRASKALGVEVSVLPRVLEVVGSSARFDYVDGLTFLGVPRFGLSRSSELAKRGFDMAGSLVLLVLTSPFMTVAAVAVKLTSPGPVFFRQARVGRHGRAFEMLKFRSMDVGADGLKDSLRHRNEQVGLFKIADDPRITRVGRLLRRSCLDELPQLFNVLRGEMSLVGPRPLVPEEDRQIRGWHRRRLQLTPGMTGPWQVLGSSRIPLDEMVTIDYLYVANWSLWNDVKIMLRTVGTVLARQGR